MSPHRAIVDDRHHTIADRDNRAQLLPVTTLAVKARRRGEVDDGSEVVRHGEDGCDGRSPVCADPLQKGKQQHGSPFRDHIDQAKMSLRIKKRDRTILILISFILMFSFWG